MKIKKEKTPFGGRRAAALLLILSVSAVLGGCGGKTPAPETTASSALTFEAKTSQAAFQSEEATALPTGAETEASAAANTPEPQSTAFSTSAQSKNEKARKQAKKRIESDIDLALWYVKEQQNNGSRVSYPYENEKTEYSALTKAQKKLYDEMLPKVRALKAFEYTAKKHGYTVLDNVLTAAFALCSDHPECAIYFDIEEVFEGDTTTALRSSYFLPGDPDAKSLKNTAKIKKEVEIFEEECNLIVEAIPKNFSTYDKYRYLAAVISIRTGYDHSFENGKQTSTAYGAIQGGSAICQGYSTAFEYLCKKANLWCRQVSGVSHGVSHAWNLVKLKGGTYHVDVTWADDDYNSTLDDGWHRYFMLTQEEILEDHEIDDKTVATGKKSFRTEAAG